VRDPQDLGRAADALGPAATVDLTRSRLALPTEQGAEDLIAALRALDDAGVALADIALRRPTLDDVFLALTGHPPEGETSAEDEHEAAA
jgi:hypothetical protein